MKTDNVSAAFELILEAIDSVVSDVNSQGAVFLLNGEYSQLKSSITESEVQTACRSWAEVHNNEWPTGLGEPIRLKTHVPAKRMASFAASARREPHTVLAVKFADGRAICEATAAETFVKAPKLVAREKVSQLYAVENFRSSRRSADGQCSASHTIISTGVAQ